MNAGGLVVRKAAEDEWTQWTTEEWGSYTVEGSPVRRERWAGRRGGTSTNLHEAVVDYPVIWLSPLGESTDG